MTSRERADYAHKPGVGFSRARRSIGRSGAVRCFHVKRFGPPPVLDGPAMTRGRSNERSRSAARARRRCRVLAAVISRPTMAGARPRPSRSAAPGPALPRSSAAGHLATRYHWSTRMARAQRALSGRIGSPERFVPEIAATGDGWRELEQLGSSLALEGVTPSPNASSTRVTAGRRSLEELERLGPLDRSQGAMPPPERFWHCGWPRPWIAAGERSSNSGSSIALRCECFQLNTSSSAGARDRRELESARTTRADRPLRGAMLSPECFGRTSPRPESGRALERPGLIQRSGDARLT